MAASQLVTRTGVGAGAGAMAGGSAGAGAGRSASFRSNSESMRGPSAACSRRTGRVESVNSGKAATAGAGAGSWAASETAGAGLDLQTSRHLVWSADYLFSHDVPAVDPASDTHRVTVGVTIKR